MQLEGKTALVTGASSGIGRGIAKQLALEGVQVIAVARRNELLNTLSDEILSLDGIKPVLIEQDLMQEDASEKLLTYTKDLGQVDIIINNAGQSGPTSLETTNQEWEHSMALNYFRPRQLSHTFLPNMIKNGWGRIINITGIGEPMCQQQSNFDPLLL